MQNSIFIVTALPQLLAKPSLLEKQYKLEHMKQVCLPQGSVATLFTCGRQIQNNHECEVCRAFCIPEIINIILFLDQFAYKTIRISLF